MQPDGAEHTSSYEPGGGLFSGVGKKLNNEELFIIYSPFNYNGQYTSPSNAQFDIWLKQQDPKSGIKNFEFLDSLARQTGLQLLHDIEMPANNKILCWKKLIPDLKN